MILIQPVALADANLVSSSIAENDYAEWSAATTYALGNRVIKAAAHRIYESLIGGNLNHDPETSPTQWADVGPTNRWAMLDGQVGTASVAATSISVRLAPGRIDALALLQIEAAALTVEMYVTGDLVWSHSASLIDNSNVVDWYVYFFGKFRTRRDYVVTGLPPIGECEVVVTLTRTVGDVACGMIVFGTKEDIGGTLASPKLGINDFSKKGADDFGNPVLVKRAYSKRMSVSLAIDAPQVDAVHAALSEVRATPVVWVGSGAYASMIVYGWYRDFEIDVAYLRLAYCTLTIEGII